MKKYSTPNLIKAVSLGTVIATLLSSVSPVVASNLAITGDKNLSSSGADVPYKQGSHGSIVFAGDDNYCGVDNVIGRGGKGQSTNNQITAEEQYNRIAMNKDFSGRYPYGETTSQVIWAGDSNTSNGGAYMGSTTGGLASVMPEAFGVYSFATGCGSSAMGNYSTAFGAGATTKGGGAQAFGVSALAGGRASIAIGVGSETTARSTIAIGGLAKAESIDSIALGTKAHTSDQDAIAVGYNAQAQTRFSIAIGSDAIASKGDGVALGAASVASVDRNIAGYDPVSNSVSENTSGVWKSKKSAVSVGKADGSMTRQITGLAAGTADSDAVNIAQLKALREVATKGWKLSVNGANATDVLAENTVDLVADGNNSNIKIVKNNNKVTFDLADNIHVTSVTAGRSVLSDDGLVLAGGPTITPDGIMAGKKTITDVAAGIKDTDAVNVAQLNAVKESSKTSWQLSVNSGDATAIGQNGIVNLQAAGNENKQNIKIEKDNNHNVTFDLADDLHVMSVTAGESIMDAVGFRFTDAGPSITVTGIHAGNKTIKGVSAGQEDTDAVNVGQLKKIESQIAENSLVKWDEQQKRITIGAEKDGIEINIANNKNETRIISGVAVGKVSVDSTEAVNGEQLFNIDKNISDFFGGETEVINGVAPTFTIQDNKYKSVADAFTGVSNSITEITNQITNATKNSLVKQEENEDTITIGKATGGDLINIANKDGEVRRISGVKAAQEDNDAVNKKQLDDTIADITDSIKNNILVKQDKEEGARITVGKDTGGSEINIANNDGDARTISGVKAAVNNDEAVNKEQLEGSIADVVDSIKSNSLVKWNGEQSLITIGNEKDGSKISIANKSGEARTISGVKAAEADDEAVNKKQLDGRIAEINNNIKNVNDFAVLYDKDEDDSVNYNSITLGGDKTRAPVALHNVQAGTIAKNSLDAINGSQINKISEDVAYIFGGGAEFKDGILFGPLYHLSRISEDGTPENRDFNNVGDALVGLDKNINNVNDHLTNVANDFTQQINNISQVVKGDALLWSEDEQAFVAQHGQNGEKDNSKLKFLANGDISSDSTDAINGSQLFQISQKISDIFGGDVDIINGIGPSYTIQGKEHNTVISAFEGVNNSITEISNQIANAAKNSLVKQEGENSLITVGKATGGTEINIANNDGEARTISGVKAAEADDEAVNKKQLDGRIAEINNNIKNVNDFAVLYDKDEDDSVNYNSITLGGDKTRAPVALHNVQAGTIAKNSLDAINGSQINKISEGVAYIFGGGAEFKDGILFGPLYHLSRISEDGTPENRDFNNVGDALVGLDKNINNVNDHLTNVANDFTQQINNISQVVKGDALLWSEDEQAFVAQHGQNGEKDNSKLKFLANGDIARDSTDAINGSQLYQTNQKLNELGDSVHDISTNISNYFGGSTDVVNGIKPTFVIKDQTYRNVTDAFTGVNISIANLDGKISEMGKNNLVQQQGGASGIITIGKATAGTEINIAGVGGVGRTISGVKEAEKGDEAVNKDQLDKSIEKISKNIETASAAAVLYDKEDGVVDYNRVTLGGKNSTGPVALLNVKDGRIAANSTDAITGNQLYVMSNQLAAYFGGGAGYKDGNWTAPNFKVAQLNADGTTVEKSYNNVAEALDGVNSGMINMNNRIDHVIDKVASDALKWDDWKGAYDASHSGQPSKIVNVADGKIVEGSKDAVNGGQLWQTNERVAGVEKDIEHIGKRVDNISATVTNIGETVTNIENRVDNIENTVNNLSDGAVNYDKTEDGKKTNKITLKGGNESEPVMIDNLADGRIEKGSKEAINGGQLHDYTEQQMKIVLDESKHYTDQRVKNIVVDAIDNAVDQAKQYTDVKFNILSYDIKSVRKEARQAAAVGLAVSNLRYFDEPGSLSVSFGSGAWRGQSAFAFGAGYTSENGKIRSNLSATSAGGHWGVGGAITLKIK